MAAYPDGGQLIPPDVVEKGLRPVQVAADQLPHTGLTPFGMFLVYTGVTLLVCGILFLVILAAMEAWEKRGPVND